MLNSYLRTAFTDFEVNLRALAVTAIVTVAVATAGKVSVRAAYIVTGRANENCIT